MNPRHLCLGAGMTLGLSVAVYRELPTLSAALLVVGVIAAAAGLLWPSGLRRLSWSTLHEAHRWALNVNDDKGAEVLVAERRRRLREEVGHD